jgi:hypothetical protein
MSSRRSGRALRRLIVFVVVVAILAVAADRAAKWLAEDQLATMAEQEAAQYDVRAADTSVEVGGFGFLPQLVKQEFSTVTLTMRQPTISSIPAEDLTVVMSGVHVPRAALTGGSDAAVTVDTTDMQVRLSPTELAKLAARTTGVDDLTMPSCPFAASKQTPSSAPRRRTAASSWPSTNSPTPSRPSYATPSRPCSPKASPFPSSPSVPRSNRSPYKAHPWSSAPPRPTSNSPAECSGRTAYLSEPRVLRC